MRLCMDRCWKEATKIYGVFNQNKHIFDDKAENDDVHFNVHQNLTNLVINGQKVMINDGTRANRTLISQDPTESGKKVIKLE